MRKSEAIDFTSGAIMQDFVDERELVAVLGERLLVLVADPVEKMGGEDRKQQKQREYRRALSGSSA